MDRWSATFVSGFGQWRFFVFKASFQRLIGLLRHLREASVGTRKLGRGILPMVCWFWSCSLHVLLDVFIRDQDVGREQSALSVHGAGDQLLGQLRILLFKVITPVSLVLLLGVLRRIITHGKTRIAHLLRISQLIDVVQLHRITGIATNVMVWVGSEVTRAASEHMKVMTGRFKVV